ncbi:MAG: WXG100 family type VII secretion target [Oscillospiraceae bacterium]|nr:WXG100 family type VII secretion target [Oscillospiraceae bacterium]
MPVKFYVETSTLRNTASQFESSSRTWNNTISRMLDLVRATGYQWVGDASDAYRRKFQQHDQDRNDIIGLINEHMRDLREIADNFDKNEQKLAGEANSLRTNVVH